MEFIREYKNSISVEICDEIIRKFELEEDKYSGRTITGVNTHIKDTTDYVLYDYNNNKLIKDIWKNIDKILYDELHHKLKSYITELDDIFFNDISYNLFKNQFLSDDGFMIQKYKQGIGKYIYHHDFKVDMIQNRHRVITYLWYLNDVDEGGTTEFLGGKLHIKPEKGKLILFPASWSFPHRGNVPISSDKYIITGWFYEEDNEKIVNIINNMNK
jgi:hypothetical protein